MLFFFNGCKSIVWSQFIALGIVLVTISFLSLFFHFSNVPLNYIIFLNEFLLIKFTPLDIKNRILFQKNTLKTFNLIIFFRLFNSSMYQAIYQARGSYLCCCRSYLWCGSYPCCGSYLCPFDNFCSTIILVIVNDEMRGYKFVRFSKKAIKSKT